MDVCLLCVLCVVRWRSLRWADHSSRGVLSTVARRCVWSRNLVIRGGHSPRWAAEPEKIINNKQFIMLRCRLFEQHMFNEDNFVTYSVFYILQRTDTQSLCHSAKLVCFSGSGQRQPLWLVAGRWIHVFTID
jgi:hypothetical protein